MSDEMLAKVLVAISQMREEMRQEFGHIREEMHRELGKVREEMRGELGKGREEMHRELGSVREEMHREFSEVRLRLDSIEEDIAVLVEDSHNQRKAIHRLKRSIPAVQHEADLS